MSLSAQGRRDMIRTAREAARAKGRRTYDALTKAERVQVLARLAAELRAANTATGVVNAAFAHEECVMASERQRD